MPSLHQSRRIARDVAWGVQSNTPGYRPALCMFVQIMDSLCLLHPFLCCALSRIGTAKSWVSAYQMKSQGRGMAVVWTYIRLPNHVPSMVHLLNMIRFRFVDSILLAMLHAYTYLRSTCHTNDGWLYTPSLLHGSMLADTHRVPVAHVV